ncbi:hypothetical protein CDL15_Pgr021295 [Punica granatum]|uniref:Uncharacterized protein n=1 Tax=Punica granatum TaxID=22663 RepID=A0A218WQ18_PUNGR|nr:hypothetical protein CDL15_Pgr021295 [Punica granatum]
MLMRVIAVLMVLLFLIIKYLLLNLEFEMVEVPKTVKDNSFSSYAAKNTPDNKPVSKKLDGLDNSLSSKEIGSTARNS